MKLRVSDQVKVGGPKSRLQISLSQMLPREGRMKHGPRLNMSLQAAQNDLKSQTRRNFMRLTGISGGTAVSTAAVHAR